MQMSDNVQELFAGLVKLRAKIKQPSKLKSNPFFKSKYVDLEGVQKAIDDAKEGTGIDYTQFIETSPDGMTGVSTMIYSDKGDYIISDPLYLKPAKNDPQGNGSVITYSRRYQLSSMFGISSDIDDDGNNASGNYQQANGNYQRNNYKKRRQQPQQQQDPIALQKKQFTETVNKLSAALNRPTQEINQGIHETVQNDKDYQNAGTLRQWQMVNNTANKMLTKAIEENKKVGRLDVRQVN